MPGGCYAARCEPYCARLWKNDYYKHYGGPDKIPATTTV